MSNQETDRSNEGFQANFNQKLEDLFTSVITERRAFYSKNPGAVPRQANVGDIIGGYANNNALISGSISLIPGPLGMAAALPELVLVFRNQLQMVCDIGRAMGKDREMSTELLLGIFARSLGVGAMGVMTIHSGKVLVRRSSLRILQSIIAALGGKITQRALKGMIGKWLPGIGAMAMGYYSRYTTIEMGQKAVEIFGMEIETEVA